MIQHVDTGFILTVMDTQYCFHICSARNDWMCYVMMNFCCVYLVNVLTRWQKKNIWQFKTKKRPYTLGLRFSMQILNGRLLKSTRSSSLLNFYSVLLRVHANIWNNDLSCFIFLIIIFVQRSEGQTFLKTVTIFFSFSFKCVPNSVQCIKWILIKNYKT